MPASSSDRKVASASSGSMISPQIQSFFTSQSQQPSLGLFPTNLPNDSAALYQQPISQLQRSISATNQQPLQTGLYDDVQRPFRPTSSAAPGSGTFFSQNMQISQSHQQQLQQPNDIMARLTQAMQNHGQQQQEKAEEQRRIEQQRHEMELERLKSVKMEQSRLQREEEERRRLEQLKQQQQQQQQMTINEELKKPQTIVPTQMMLNQMREMAKMIEQKNAQQSVQNHQMKPDIDPLLAFQQSLQFQKEQQAKIEAQKYLFLTF